LDQVLQRLDLGGQIGRGGPLRGRDLPSERQQPLHVRTGAEQPDEERGERRNAADRQCNAGVRPEKIAEPARIVHVAQVQDQPRGDRHARDDQDPVHQAPGAEQLGHERRACRRDRGRARLDEHDQEEDRTHPYRPRTDVQDPENDEEPLGSDHEGSVASTPAMGRIPAWRSGAALMLVACTAVAHPPPSGHPTLVPPSGAALGSSAAASPGSAGPTPPRPRILLTDASWTRAIDGVVAGRDVAVAVGVRGRIIYLHRGRTPRVLASNEKILTSMTALDVFGARHRFPTVAAADARVRGGRLRGNLWLIGAGDPGLTAARLATLAARLHAPGIRRITGSIEGDTSAFDRGWWAPGWLAGISRSYVTRPTALAIDGNRGAGSPERDAASALRPG